MDLLKQWPWTQTSLLSLYHRPPNHQRGFRGSLASLVFWGYDFRMSQLKAMETMLTTENEKMAAALATDMKPARLWIGKPLRRRNADQRIPEGPGLGLG